MSPESPAVRSAHALTGAYRVAEDRSISMERATLYLFVLATPLVVLQGVAYGLVWGFARLGAGLDSLLSIGVALPVFIVGIVAHEAIHGLTWAALARLPLSRIRFGVQWRTVTPYAHARVPLRASTYRWGTAMPLVLLGVVPALVGAVWGDPEIAAFGLVFTLVAGGDLAILRLIRDVPGHAWVQDHPERAGCLVVVPDEAECPAPAPDARRPE